MSEFLVTNYLLGDSIPIFWVVMGPYLGKRLFILPAKWASARSRLLDMLHTDILRFMTQEAGAAILQDYPEVVRKSNATKPWSPTWFEKQILTIKQEENTEIPPMGKRKKMATTTAKKEEPLAVHMDHKHHANKVQSETAASETFKRMDMMEQSLNTLKETNVELMQMIGEMRENQHRDQTKIIGLESEILETTRKVMMNQQELKKCKAAITSVETQPATLSTKEETSERFDQIEEMLSGVIDTRKSARINKPKSLTEKRKEKALDNETVTASDDEEAFADSQQNMDTEEMEGTRMLLTNGNKGEGNQTNSHPDINSKNMRVK
jgi:hypothetical protein